MANPTAVCLSKANVDAHILKTLPPSKGTPPVQKLPSQYSCFTTVACHLDGSDWVLQNMPIHRWLLQAVFNTAILDTVGITVANAKARQFKPKPKAAGGAAPVANQNATAIVPVGIVKRGSKARQGRRIKFGITGTLAAGLTALIDTRNAPKPFGKAFYKSATVIMPSRITNPQIGAWFSTHLPVAKLNEITNGSVYTVGGTPIGVIDLSAPADFAKQFPSINSTRTGQTLQSSTDAPVVEYV